MVAFCSATMAMALAFPAALEPKVRGTEISTAEAVPLHQPALETS
jgi:hypothetical protein